LDRGLYGAFIVEPKEGIGIDRNYTLVLDEWMSSGEMSGMNMSGGNMSEMDHSKMNMGNSVTKKYVRSAYHKWKIRFASESAPC
jgi:FtsP/CotA-like multicopper oxidase with cupredoxin domain